MFVDWFNFLRREEKKADGMFFPSRRRTDEEEGDGRRGECWIFLFLFFYDLKLIVAVTETQLFFCSSAADGVAIIYFSTIIDWIDVVVVVAVVVVGCVDV